MLSIEAGVAGAFGRAGNRSRRSDRVASGARFALSLLIGAAVLALTLFHVAIFWSHLDSGRLVDPLVAGRWALSLVVVGFFVLLRRRGVPLFWGRRAIVIWMLVVLLHWTAGAPGQAATIEAPHATGILFLLPTVTVPVAAAVALLLFASLTVQAARTRRLWNVIPPSRLGRIRTCQSRQLVPRAPPHDFI